ncbi:MAG TPA: FHA domain-containing protein [Anaerolineaceae bacterium]|nr:FHA domain-containing protein [Anaerolineaceae bacterium]
MAKILRYLVSLSILLSFNLASAQSDFTAILSQPQTASFPEMVSYLDVRDSGGGFLSGLKPDQVTLQEDNRPVALDGLSEIQRPVQFLTVINASRELALRDANGAARYDPIDQTLIAWADAAPADLPRSYALIANGSPDVTGLSSAAAWKAALEAYHPDFRAAKPSSDALARAVDQAGGPASASAGADEPPPQRVILYITPVPEAGDLNALNGILQRAKESGVHIMVWMVASPSAFDSPGAQLLAQIAQETGGQFSPFSGAEGLPDLEGYLVPLHKIYRLRYHSAIRGGGATHTLAAQIRIDQAAALAAGPIQYDLAVLPPNPMLVSPPLTITRTSPRNSETPLSDLAPITYPLQVLVEFPDGHPRPLSVVRLYVDGKLAAEKAVSAGDGTSSRPGVSFDWDLSAYTTSGQHTLRVEVADSLGMTKSSLETPVEVQISLPLATLWERLSRSNFLASAGAVLLAGLSLALVLVLINRQRTRLMRKKVAASRSAARALSPTAPLPSQGERAGSGDGRQRLWPEKLHWPSHNPHAPADAALLRLNPSLDLLTGDPFSIQGKEVTFGSDPAQATCLIQDASVAGLHARLHQEADGSYLLLDHGSTSGTWVNFSPVLADGIRLEHGDVIHIGRCAFRFQQTRPAHVRKPRVQPYNEML